MEKNEASPTKAARLAVDRKILLPLCDSAVGLRFTERIELDMNIAGHADRNIVVGAIDNVISSTAPVTVLGIPGAIALELPAFYLIVHSAFSKDNEQKVPKYVVL